MGNGINDAGQIVGNAMTAAGLTHASIWTAGVISDLGTLGGSLSDAIAANASGAVAGHSWLAGDGLTQAFVYANGVMVDTDHWRSLPRE